MAELILTKGYVAIVDDDDYPLVSRWKWSALGPTRRTNLVYAIRREQKTIDGVKIRTGILLHRFLMQAPDHMLVDHIDGNPLNNSRRNLRLATYQENAIASRRRTSLFRGVCAVNDPPGYSARIRIDGRKTYLGFFKTAEEAARAYDTAATTAFGRFAILNFPDPSLTGSGAKME